MKAGSLHYLCSNFYSFQGWTYGTSLEALDSGHGSSRAGFSSFARRRYWRQILNFEDLLPQPFPRPPPAQPPIEARPLKDMEAVSQEEKEQRHLEDIRIQEIDAQLEELGREVERIKAIAEEYVRENQF